jgi:hypothetical protein
LETYAISGCDAIERPVNQGTAMPIAYLRQLALALERTRHAVRVTHPFHLVLVQWLWSRGYIEAKISAAAATSRAAEVLSVTGLGRQLIGQLA